MSVPPRSVPPQESVDPLLLKAAQLARRHGIIVVIGQEPLALSDPHHLPFPLVGQRFGPVVSIVATRLGWGDPVNPPVVLAADRTGRTIVLDRRCSEPLVADDPTSVISDLARRSLGLPAPDVLGGRPDNHRGLRVGAEFGHGLGHPDVVPSGEQLGQVSQQLVSARQDGERVAG